MCQLLRNLTEFLLFVILTLDGIAAQREIESELECTEHEFDCGEGGGCINYAWRCDEIEDCLNSADEMSCESSHCPSSTHWRCPSTGRCVPHQWKCDGDDDCDKGEDEEGCATAKCLPGWVRCSSGQCIPPFSICDQHPDCKTGEDESAELCEIYDRCSSSSQKFRCYISENRACIPDSWRCDGNVDCPRGEDENECDRNITRNLYIPPKRVIPLDP